MTTNHYPEFMTKNILRFTILCIVSFFLLGDIKSFAQTNTSIPDAVKQVYGDATASFSKEQVDWLVNQLERSKVQKKKLTTGEAIPLLSSVSLMSKFISSLQKDDFSNPQSINPLKYNIDFFKTEDQFFRIDGTDYVLFIAGKK
jgi:hypothetical protein